MNDLKFAIRQLLKNPGFAAVAALTLAPVISRSIRPGKALLLVGVQPPDTQTGRCDSDHRAHSLGARAEGWVTKESANKVRRFILSNSQNHQAVPNMEERTSGQSQVAGEERWMGKCLRERDLPKVRALLDTSPELLHAGDLRSNQPIHWAVMTRQLDVIDELLQRGADINARRYDGGRPIHLTNGDYHFRGWRDVPKDWPTSPGEVYRHLLSRGANVDLGMACATGDIARVRELLDQDPSLVNLTVRHK